MSTWDEQKIKILKDNWGKLTASAIAEKIGGISRNAVIGKAHRLKLSISVKSHNNNALPTIQKKQTSNPNIGSTKIGRRSKFKSLLIEKDFNRILCSGHELSAEKGLENLINYNKISNGRITIMPGGGVNLDNFQKFKRSSFNEIHLSAINLNDSPHSNFNIIKEIVELSK